MGNQQKTEHDKHAMRTFHGVFSLIGIVVVVYSAFNVPYSELGIEFILIAGLTLTIGPRIAIDFTDFKSNVSVADIFIYLVAILYDVESAAIVAAADAYITSSRFTKNAETRAFNAGIMAVSIFASYKIASVFFGSLTDLAHQGFSPLLFGAMLTMIVAHYFINSSCVAISTALRTNRPIFETWKTHYVWLFIPFLATGSVALVTANAIETSGILSLFIILPFVGIIYFSYRAQQEKLQAVYAQSEQIEQHLVEMKESEERFRSAFSNAPIGIGIISKQGNWVAANESLFNSFAFSGEDTVSKSIYELLHPDDVAQFHRKIAEVIRGTRQSFQGELRYFDKNGKEIWTQTSISRLNDAENSKLICQIQDITARHEAEERLRYDACYDSLTGLSNRGLFMERLEQSIALHTEDKDYRFVVIFVDLDKFKLVNDSSGHTVGDKLLVAVAQRLKKCLPKDSTLARFGSDEFLILFDNDVEQGNITRLVEEIQRQLSMVYKISSQEISITASIGVVFVEPFHETPEDVLRDADTALHIAKSRGRSHCVFFDDEMRVRATNQMKLEKDLQTAVERNELFLLYQPIISLPDDSIAGFEALIRWNHPQLGLVPPSEFIPIAEENGTIINIGQHVLDEACGQLSKWRDDFEIDLPITMSINVSAKQLLQRQLLVEILEALGRHRIEPHQIRLELTESVVVENTEFVISTLKQFRAMGVGLSMDDFGTGFSSLSYLHKLPLSNLKIDRSFVSQMTSEAESKEIVKTIVLLAKNLDLELVAEGIETEEQLELLRELGCQYGQGYYFARPLDVADASEFIKASLSLPQVPFEQPNLEQGELLV